MSASASIISSTVASTTTQLSDHASRTARHQNWILDPLQDAIFIIAAPVLVIIAALLAFRMLGGVQATTLIIVTHIIFTVAHHLPTFIRIYGDKELLQRFKWSIVLAPVVPVAFCSGVLAYINYKDYPVEYFLYLYIMLAIWDPWHFLRQHFGFMRIYDRQNAAPRKLASRMDWWICATWFIFIMLASSSWLASVLEDMNSSAGLGLLTALPTSVVPIATTAARDFALGASVLYGGYLLWCVRKGYFISPAKLALVVLTFAAMFIAYTPNQWILHLAPEWTFKVGFAVIGIVHMTQYLAIVWRYNRSLTQRAGRARSGLFSKLHTRGGWLVAIAYVIVCLIYGDVITTRHESSLLMSVLLTIGFTSTLLHYYYDGFIWKVRHTQNAENLADSAESNTPGSSWWSVAKHRAGPGRTAIKHLAYFGIPMAVLTAGAVSVWSAPSTSYVDYMYRAQALNQKGRIDLAIESARQAYSAMQTQLPLAERLTALDPSASREAELAFLIYNESFYRHVVLPSIDGLPLTKQAAAEHRRATQRAAEMLEKALAQGGSLAHVGRDEFTRDRAQQTLASWRRTAYPQ
jgi:hypothetical protein